MRRIVPVLVLVFSFHLMDAQPESEKGYVGFSAGMSLPVAGFGSTSPDDNDAGYAKTGFSAFASAHILVKDFIGFAGMMGYCNNPYNQESFTENYIASHPGFDYEFSADNYTMINMLGGAFVSIPQGLLDINLKGLLGIAVCTLPGTASSSFSGIPGDPRFVLETGRTRSTAFTYGGGVNLMFHTNRSLAFIVDATYLQAEPEFNVVEIRVYENGELTVLSGLDLRQKFQMIIVGAGIAFTF